MKSRVPVEPTCRSIPENRASSVVDSVHKPHLPRIEETVVMDSPVHEYDSLRSPSEQVPPQLGNCQGPPAGWPPVGMDAPIGLPGSVRTLPASSALSLPPDMAFTSSPSDQVPAQIGSRPGHRAGLPPVAGDAPIALPGTNHPLPTSSPPPLAPDLDGSSSVLQSLITLAPPASAVASCLRV